MPCNLTPEESRAIDRANAVAILTLISSPEDQLEYERNVPIASIPTEILCQWFSDFYWCGLQSFRDSFSPEELAPLAEFDAFFRAHDSLLPKRPDSIQIWLDDPTWQSIVAKARETLRRWRELNPEP